MSAAELRQAAGTLRELVGSATPDPDFWRADGVVMWACDGGWITPQDQLDAAYIATMHPGVGLALADLLDFAAETARGWEAIGHVEPTRWPEPTRLAHVLARLINGGAS